MKTKAVIFTGGRDFSRLDAVKKIVLSIPPEEHIIVCDATGVDFAVWNYRPHNYARKFAADWKKHSKAAGPIRNSEMVKYAKKFDTVRCFAFWNGKSKGTLDCIAKCVSAGFTVYIIPENRKSTNDATEIN